MGQQCEKLAELIRLYENQLANLERNKEDLVQQSFLHGLRFYEEIQWISDNSRIRLQGRNRPVQMLKIELQLDSQEAARQRMKEYIEECILKVREMIRQERGGGCGRKNCCQADVQPRIAQCVSGQSLYSGQCVQDRLEYAEQPLEALGGCSAREFRRRKVRCLLFCAVRPYDLCQARAMEAAGAMPVPIPGCW